MAFRAALAKCVVWKGAETGAIELDLQERARFRSRLEVPPEQKAETMKFGKNTSSGIHEDLSTLLNDVSDLLASKAKEEPRLKQAKEFVDNGISRVRGAASDAVDYSRDVARGADDYVHDSPWQVVGGALAIGVVIGMLLSRR